jgi:hypothetical protein
MDELHELVIDRLLGEGATRKAGMRWFLYKFAQ